MWFCCHSSLWGKKAVQNGVIFFYGTHSQGNQVSLPMTFNLQYIRAGQTTVVSTVALWDSTQL